MSPMEAAAFAHYEITGEVYVVLKGEAISMVTAARPPERWLKTEAWMRVWRPHPRFGMLAMKPMGNREQLFFSDLALATARAAAARPAVA